MQISSIFHIHKADNIYVLLPIYFYFQLENIKSDSHVEPNICHNCLWCTKLFVSNTDYFYPLGTPENLHHSLVNFVHCYTENLFYSYISNILDN